MKRLAPILIVLVLAMFIACDEDGSQKYTVTYRVTSSCNDLNIGYFDRNGNTVIENNQTSGYEISFIATSGTNLSITGISNCFVAVFNVTATILVDNVIVNELTNPNSSTATYIIP